MGLVANTGDYFLVVMDVAVLKNDSAFPQSQLRTARDKRPAWAR
jgi:hypothetical protein